jgi:hypothetical protein
MRVARSRIDERILFIRFDSVHKVVCDADRDIEVREVPFDSVSEMVRNSPLVVD